MAARRRYRGPIKLYAYLVGGPWDGCFSDNAAALVDRDSGRIYLPPPPPDDPIMPGDVATEPGYCHVYRPTDQIGRFVHDGWLAVEKEE
jgi:hypothetical protein